MSDALLKPLLALRSTVQREQNPVLGFDRFILLHRIAMAWPGGLDLAAADADVRALLDLRFVEKRAARYYITEAGLFHLSPKIRRQASGLPEKMPVLKPVIMN